MQAISLAALVAHGISETDAENFVKTIAHYPHYSPEKMWQHLSHNLLRPDHPFSLHLFLFTAIYPHWRHHPDTAPAFLPTPRDIENTNLFRFMQELRFETVKAFHDWSYQHYEAFWQTVLKKLDIRYHPAFTTIASHTTEPEQVRWLAGAKLNIVDSCFQARGDAPALLYADASNQIQHLTYAQLEISVNTIAYSLLQQEFAAGDPIAIIMPMTKEAIAIYLGIIKMGGIVVSIADSFSAIEMATRFRITATKGVFTQEYILRRGKNLALYEKVGEAQAPRAIILGTTSSTLHLRAGDIRWEDFLKSPNTTVQSVVVEPMTTCNILFSSGTTQEPKAIPWTHTTPIKVASDAFLHHNIQSGDILAWPTNLGWMMGPWLIFAALINKAAIAVYPDVATDRDFGQFIQAAGVTLLGVIPTLVTSWRETGCMAGVDWQAIKVFSSTGECSNPEDMLYLSSLAGYKPIIEYCGGTEIGGSYLSSTLIEKNYPSLFSTPAFGLNIVLLDEQGQPCTQGEVAIMPPSIGLSHTLLNADHHSVYFANMPTFNGKSLRRHGDSARQFSSGYYTLLGRTDDTMNLSGIKISAAEIERALIGIPAVHETAAIAITPPEKGPSQLIIFAATTDKVTAAMLQPLMQQRLNQQLNPLFKIHAVIVVNELPKTASHKIMRRELRKKWLREKD